MRNKGYQNYFETEVLSADPLKLVQLLYRGALDAIAVARACLRAGDIAGRSRAITKALLIVHEMRSSLDHARGGALSGDLAAIYDYIQRSLIEANVNQIDGPIAESERLLTTLLEAWMQCPDSRPLPSRSNQGQESVEPEYRSLSLAY